MPSYQYECTECNSGFEIITNIANREKPRHCRHCGKEAQRILGAPAVLNLIHPKPEGRFQDVKDVVAIEKAEREAKSKQDRTRAKKEILKISKL